MKDEDLAEKAIDHSQKILDEMGDLHKRHNHALALLSASVTMGSQLMDALDEINEICVMESSPETQRLRLTILTKIDAVLTLAENITEGLPEWSEEDGTK